MARIVQSPVSRFPGSVTLADPLTLPQVIALEDAFDQQEAQQQAGQRYRSRLFQPYVPVICSVVVEWNLENFPKTVTPETFPSSPRGATADLIEWLALEIANQYSGETQVPLA